MASNALFPIRLTEEEVLANPAYSAYVILNIPTHGQNVPFDTIGRTTFKKFVLKSYAEFYDNGSLKTSDFKSVPFVISKTPTVARVVYISNNRQPVDTNAGNPNKKKKLTPQKPNQSQSQVKQIFPPPKVAPVPAPISAPVQVQQGPIIPQIQPAVPVKNIMQPALTLEMGDSNGDYYAPSHCKWPIRKN